MTISRSIYVAANGRSSFFFMAVYSLLILVFRLFFFLSFSLKTASLLTVAMMGRILHCPLMCPSDSTYLLIGFLFRGSPLFILGTFNTRLDGPMSSLDFQFPVLL